MNKVNVLLLGSGGRESALAWKLSQSPLLGQLYIAPGNGGTGRWGENLAVSPMDFEAVANTVKDKSIGLVIAGNEDPLVAGLSDYLGQNLPEVPVMGPVKAGAALEGSKDFAKDFMTRHAIPTARYRSFTRETLTQGQDFLATLQPPYVLKADGLAAGKGVLIIDSLDEARTSLAQMLDGMFGDSSATVVIEEFLSGIECSVFVVTDGHGGYRILPVAKDYKRAMDGDKGLNTGGMGAVSPVVFADNDFMAKVEDRIVRPTIEGLIADGIDYRGFIFLGLIKVGGDPMVIEYNVRMGDPETEVVMMRLQGDLLELCLAAAKGHLGDIEVKHSHKSAATVIAVSGGYPGAYPKGKVITGNLTPDNSTLFHAGTKIDTNGNLVTSGGRVIAVSSLGDTIEDALKKSYESMAEFDFEGRFFRHDIGQDLIALANKD